MKYSVKTITLTLLAVLFSCVVEAQHFFGTIANAKKVFASNVVTEEKVYACFYIADTFMDLEEYDSAQIWLNNIFDVYKIRKPSLLNYMILSRQAEVYYYNNLLELGQDVSERALLIAKVLNDSILLADAFNFAGIFATNLNNPQQALSYFWQGAGFSFQPPYPKKYLSLSKPHHIYGNLAEAYIKLKLYDSAILYSRVSLYKAAEISYFRGVALGHFNLGQSFFMLGKIDSALVHYEQCKQQSKTSSDLDVELISYSGLALCALQQNHKTAAISLLNDGFMMLKAYPTLNILFSKQFIKDALQVYTAMNNLPGMNRSLLKLAAIDSISSIYNNRKVQNIIRYAGSAEEKILRFEVQEANQKAKMANIGFLLSLVVIGCILIVATFLYYMSRQKLKIESWRNLVSQDLHDEVGSTLSGISFLSELTMQKINQADYVSANQFLGKIVHHSKEMTDKMGDIVWSVNPNNDSFEKLIDKLSHYARQFGGTKNIDVVFKVQQELLSEIVDFNKRKHLYLIGKEAINNAIKYSNCKKIIFEFNKKESDYIFRVIDNGIGFDPKIELNGNGLKNIQYRAQEIKGKLHIFSEPGKGTCIELIF